MIIFGLRDRIVKLRNIFDFSKAERKSETRSTEGVNMPLLFLKTEEARAKEYSSPPEAEKTTGQQLARKQKPQAC